MAQDAYRAFLDVFYPIFFVVGMSIQTLSLYLIACHTPKNMSIMKWILTNTSVCQVILLVITVFCQFRMISSAIPIELRSYGLARYLDAHLVYMLHQADQFFVYMSGMSIVVTFYFKYAILNSSGTITKLRMLRSALLFHIPVMISLVVEVVQVITQALPTDIRQMYDERNKNITEYATIGILSLKTVPSRMNFVLMTGSVFVYPVIGFFFRYQISKILQQHMGLSSLIKKKPIRSFVTGLTIQAILPIFCYTPVFSLYIYCVLTLEEVLFEQYFIFVFAAFPAVLDPIVTFYFVTPYRKKLKEWLRIEQSSQVGVANVSVVLL